MLPPVHFDVDVAKLNRNQAAGSGGRGIGWENFDGQVMIIKMKRAATFKHGVSLTLSVIQ